MNQVSVSGEEKKQEFSLDRPIPSLRSFLELLIPASEILEYREYAGGQRDCFDCHLWLSTVKRSCFLLDSKKAGIRAAGFLEFKRSEQSWIKSESLEFELWLLYDEHAGLETVRGSNSGCGWTIQGGWKTLRLSWSVVTQSEEQTSPEQFTFSGDGFNSKNTLYCLNVLERAKTAMEKIKQ